MNPGSTILLIILGLLLIGAAYLMFAGLFEIWPYQMPNTQIQFEQEDGVNYISGKVDDPNVVLYGAQDNRDACQARCAEDNQCVAYTYISEDQTEKGFAKLCYGLRTRDFVRTQEPGHFSGEKILP